MRSRIPLGLALLAGLALAACGTVAATVTQPALVPLKRNPTIHISTRSPDQVRIAQSLERAGLQVADGTEADYALIVETGGEKSGFSCGALRNVRYELLVIRTGSTDAPHIPGPTDDARPALEIKARGWTGSCEPSVYDDMSRELAGQFGTDQRAISSPPAGN